MHVTFAVSNILWLFDLVSVVKQLEMFLFPPGQDASPSKGYPLALTLPLPRNTFSGTRLYTWV